MPLRLAITKASAQGEQLVADVCQWNPVTGDIVHKTSEEVHKLMDDSLAFFDSRLYDMNLRMLEAYELDKYFDLPTWQKVVAILDILAGRQSAVQVTQRWDAAKEETEDLERIRQQAYEESLRETSDATFT